MSTTRKYELVYIVSPESTDEHVAELHTQVEGIVSRLGGTIEKHEPWGRRKLAYVIGKAREGIYVLTVITGSGELMKELDRRFKVIDTIIRHLIVRVDEEEAVIERSRTKRTDQSRRRRVARGLPPDRQPGEGQQQPGDDEDRDERFEGTEA